MTDTPPTEPDFDAQARELLGANDGLPTNIGMASLAHDVYERRVVKISAALRSTFAAGSESRSGDYERGFREAHAMAVAAVHGLQDPRGSSDAEIGESIGLARAEKAVRALEPERRAMPKTAWLIEAPGPKWIAIGDDASLLLTSDANESLHYSTEDEACAALAEFPCDELSSISEDAFVVTEHEWP